MKVRITTRNMYIVDGVESIEAALYELERELRSVHKILVTFEHGLVLTKEEVDESTHIL